MISGFRTGVLRFPHPLPAVAPLYRPSRLLRLHTTRCFNAVCSAERQKVLVLSGPTGAGKSRLALELARRLDGEIISADSVQVYRGLDIGSAKPSVSERQEVPHHLVDILHPSEDYSVGQFYEDARQKTEEILSRGRVPIVTGGTGLYLRWFIYGKPNVPKASPQITSEVHSAIADLQRCGDWDAAVEFVVKEGDPGVQSLAANDWYRLRRRLEILKLTGTPSSTFEVPYDSFKEKFESSEVDDSAINSSAAELKECGVKDLEYDFICFFLTTKRLDLYRSIDSRCEEMLLGDGLLSEAKWLLDLGLMPNSNSATRAIGYRQAMDYLQLSREMGGRSSPEDFYYFLSDFQKSSRNFAKRQLTWFRNEPIYQWIDASNPLEDVLNFICNAYGDKTGKLEVPQSLRMEKDMTNPKEVRLLKAYRPKNRHFVSGEDCNRLLWRNQPSGFNS